MVRILLGLAHDQAAGQPKRVSNGRAGAGRRGGRPPPRYGTAVPLDPRLGLPCRSLDAATGPGNRPTALCTGWIGGIDGISAATGSAVATSAPTKCGIRCPPILLAGAFDVIPVPRRATTVPYVSPVGAGCIGRARAATAAHATAEAGANRPCSPLGHALRMPSHRLHHGRTVT